MKKTTLTEALDLIQELDYVPGVSMVVPDFNYTVGKRRNFDPTDSGEEFPYDEPRGNGPQNAQGDGQQGVGRGGVGWGGRPDHSGGVRQPSAAYTSTWDTTDEGADWDETQRHGGDRRNLWRDTPDGKTLKKQVGDQEEEAIPESMGAPMQTGPVAPMDGPSMHTARGYGTGSLEDPMPSNQDMNNGPGNMWGGPGTIPGTSRSWAQSPTLGDDPNNVWNVPKESNMKLKEFFDPSPVETEPLTNPGQDYLNDATDEELEDRANPGQDEEPSDLAAAFGAGEEEEHAGSVEEPDGGEDPESATGRYGGENIVMMPNIGRGIDFVMSPDKFGAARGTYGMHTDGRDKAQADMLDKRSAWDVLQHVITAMAKSVSAPQENPGNEDNDGISG
jgi:hypothetical protein